MANNTTLYLYILIGILFLLTIMFDIKSTFTKNMESMVNLTPKDTDSPELLITDVYHENNPITLDMLSKYNERIWRHTKPNTVGSYAQTTNNIEFPINPDNGTCIPNAFCYSFYKNNMIKPTNRASDIIMSDQTFISKNSEYPSQHSEVRVGYFNTSIGPFF